MRKHLFKKIAALMLVLVMVVGIAPVASAYYQCDQTIITSAKDGHVDKIMAGIDRQSFESEAQRESVKASVRYLLSESAFAAIGQGRFPYPNRNGYVETVSDGVHSHTVWAAGCYAYAKWASQVVYGSAGEQLYPKAANGSDIASVWGLSAEGLKEFVRANCQAGEHMRIDYVHSLCFLACTDEGVYFADYAGDGKPYIRLCYASYEAFFNAVRTGSSFWLSDVVKLKNGESGAAKPEMGDKALTINLTLGKSDITVNGIKSPIDNQGTTPILLNNRTLLPIRAVIEAMGGSVEWNNDERIVTLTLGERKLHLRIDSSTIWDSGKSYVLDAAPIIVGGRTMVPVRAVVEYFGADVEWDGATSTVTITYPGVK